MSVRKGPPREWPAASVVGDLTTHGPGSRVVNPTCEHPWWSVPLSYLVFAFALALVLAPITWGIVALVDCR